jgi:cytochrome c peroxidase
MRTFAGGRAGRLRTAPAGIWRRTLAAAGTTALVAGAILPIDAGHAQTLLDFEPAEIKRILQHGPWPPATARDPSNRASGDPRAAALGQRLFFDPRLSLNGAIACASCHVPERAWTDGRPRAQGLDRLDRNTPTVLDAGLHRWFSWDGRSDSLWAQSVKPILDPREMGASARHVVAAVAADPTLACLYREVFGPPAADDERGLVNVGKALAAFMETIRSGRTAFDEFRDALARGDRAAAARYPVAAQRGLKIFVGSGNCALCHVGPHFTNGEFHDVGVPFFVGPGRVDTGRHDGIKRLRADRFNLLGPYNDDATGASATKTRHVEPNHANFGQFKTSALRNVALTPPYMHDGRYATLPEVVRHYSTLNMERLHTHGEQLLRPLGLSAAASDDLVAFLESLTDPRAAAGPPPLASAGACASR